MTRSRSPCKRRRVSPCKRRRISKGRRVSKCRRVSKRRSCRPRRRCSPPLSFAANCGSKQAFKANMSGKKEDCRGNGLRWDNENDMCLVEAVTKPTAAEKRAGMLRVAKSRQNCFKQKADKQFQTGIEKILRSGAKTSKQTPMNLANEAIRKISEEVATGEKNMIAAAEEIQNIRDALRTPCKGEDEMMARVKRAIDAGGSPRGSSGSAESRASTPTHAPPPRGGAWGSSFGG